MKIAVVASECVPFSKTGGLADVVGTLPKSLAGLGHEVYVILPYYRQTKAGSFGIQPLDTKLEVALADKMVSCTVHHVEQDNVRFYFIEKDEYFNRENLYGTAEGDYPDNAARFMFFSKAALMLLKALGSPPDILHCHDWQSGLAPILVHYMRGNDEFFANVRTVYTIHNLAYQGMFWHLDMPMTGLPWYYFTPEGIEFYGKINMMKGGIVFSDMVNTVSVKYSQEIQTPEYGCGLDGVLRAHSKKLRGILNGVDYNDWSPEKDELIAANYSADDLSGKAKCREDLLEEYKLTATPSQPIIGVISRLADQKGFDLLAEEIEAIMHLDIRFILLGTGDQKYHDLFQEIADKYPKKAGIKIAFNNKIAHKIEAGCDMFLMPSRYEPCGLNQIYSLRYGTVPIVRATGGLDDTIVDFDAAEGKGNGFKFTEYTGQELLETIERAVSTFADRKKWLRIMRNGMACDFSWDASAREYITMFKAIEHNLKTATV